MLIARRLIAHASEDVGMADSQALVVAVSALTALKNMGVPEGLIPLSHAIVYVCEAPKSNSVIMAMTAAGEDAEKVRDDVVPSYLKNHLSSTPGDKHKGEGYKYPHDYGGYVEQQYLPDSLAGKVYYVPSDNGFEKNIPNMREEKGKKTNK